MGDPEPIAIRPQPGPQEAFLASSADIAIAGGAAGGGKTWGLLMEPLYHVGNRHFGAVIFRRTYPQITNEGGLWDESAELYPLLGASSRENDHEYRFPSGATVRFAHLQHAKDRFAWKGAQIPLIGFDQLEDFEEEQFWYLLSRNRSARAGIKPYIRATCNPVPEDDPTGGWLNRLIAWWIDPDTGYAIAERSGVIRWFVRMDEKIHWGASRDELRDRFPGRPMRPKSLTFIPATLEDNPALERADPDYRAWLEALPLVERERLLRGNWKIRPTAGKVFNRAWFGQVETLPRDVVQWVRYWDKAGTEGGGKYSAGALVGRRECGRFLIASVVRGQWSARNRERVIKQTAISDRETYGRVTTWIEQEPGSGGKESAENTKRNLAGFDVRIERVTGDKLTRAQPLAAQAEGQEGSFGNVDLLVGAWNEDFLQEAHRFDGVTGFTDQIDAAGGAFNKVTLGRITPAQPKILSDPGTDALLSRIGF